MDPARLKREFGKHCTFWGGACSTQTTMTFGTVEDVVNEAKERIKVFAPGGGFVFNQIHNIQTGVSPEKIVALYDTGLQYGVPSFYKE
jgi:uroporphyrinogen decarboxylase